MLNLVTLLFACNHFVFLHFSCKFVVLPDLINNIFNFQCTFAGVAQIINRIDSLPFDEHDDELFEVRNSQSSRLIQSHYTNELKNPSKLFVETYLYRIM